VSIVGDDKIIAIFAEVEGQTEIQEVLSTARIKK
jgi:hypothetical protein